MNKWIRLLVVGLVVFPLTALAETSPAAQKWIDGIAEAYKKAPLKVEIDGTMGIGTPMQGSLKGDIVIKDESHQRVNIRMQVGADQGNAMQVDMLTVSDGTNAWTEMGSPMGKQVIKISLEEAAKMGAQGMGAPGMGSMDPLSMTEQLSKSFDFELTGVADGKATLQAKIKEEDRASLGGAAGAAVDTITIVLDEKTGFPVQLVIGGAQPFLTMDINNLRFVKESELPADAFSYTPPEGVPVIDGAQAMRGRAPGGGR